MNRINPEKLLLGKWTSLDPNNREKHFIATSLYRDDDDRVSACEIEAVLSRRTVRMSWKQLKSRELWLFGWK